MSPHRLRAPDSSRRLILTNAVEHGRRVCSDRDALEEVDLAVLKYLLPGRGCGHAGPLFQNVVVVGNSEEGERHGRAGSGH